MPDVIRDPFHRALASLIAERLEERKEALAGGGASLITEDVVSVSEKYAAAVSYIQALRDVLGLCQQIESNQDAMGPRAASVKVVER